MFPNEKPSFVSVHQAESTVYHILVRFDRQTRDRILRHVNEHLNAHREPLRLPSTGWKQVQIEDWDVRGIIQPDSPQQDKE